MKNRFLKGLELGRKEREAEIIEIIKKARKEFYLTPKELKWLIKQIKQKSK